MNLDPAAPASSGGAPLGNQNARQHGLYSRQDPIPPADQIAALRVYLARLAALLPGLTSVREIARALRRFALASQALARLVRAGFTAPPPTPRPPSASPGRDALDFSSPSPFIHPLVYNLARWLFKPSLTRSHFP